MVSKTASWANFGTIVGDLTEDMVDGLDELPEAETTDAERWSTGDVYDLTGRRVTNLQPGTIYVRDGKKFMFGK